MGSTVGREGRTSLRTCPSCGEMFPGRAKRCGKCGTLMSEEVEAIRDRRRRARGAMRTRKNRSDGLFLFGLVVGGPLMTLGGQPHAGLFVILGGACASALYRYTSWSAVGSGLIGCLAALLLASLFLDPALDLQEDIVAGETARMAYMAGLAENDPDILADARGPGGVTGWFIIPSVMSGECGEYPAAPVRAHLRDLGFLRIVVSAPSRSGGVCTFSP